MPDSPEGCGKALKLGLISDHHGQPSIHEGSDIGPNLVKAINSLVRKAALRLGLAFKWSTLQLNLGTSSSWHVDGGFHAVLAFALGLFSWTRFVDCAPLVYTTTLITRSRATHDF